MHTLLNILTYLAIGCLLASLYNLYRTQQHLNRIQKRLEESNKTLKDTL
jgi:hypothetical protein